VSQCQRLEGHFKELGRLGSAAQAIRIQRQLLSLLSSTLISGTVTQDSATMYGDADWAIQWIEMKAPALALCSVFTEGDQEFQRRCLAIVFCLPGATGGTTRLQRQAAVVRSVRLAWRLKPVDGGAGDETESDGSGDQHSMAQSPAGVRRFGRTVPKHEKVTIYPSSMIL
jgi:hypothetical protein